MILYIHIPFCTSKCGYCAFNSYTDHDDFKEAYIHALCEDLKHSLLQNFQNPIRITSIFFGGGTPNTLPVKSYEKIFECIHKYCYLYPNCEITAEANPDLISQEWCVGMKHLGVGRISVGVQSFFADKLLFLQREHKQNQISYAIESIYQSGIENTSIDLIYDTPQDSKKRIFTEIENASKLPINHLSAYSLSIEKGTKLAKITTQNPQNQSYCQEARDALRHYGFSQYEVSNYARGYKVAHNLAYWNAQEYIGCGAGAVGRIGDRRIYSHSSIPSYIKTPTEKRYEFLSKQDLRMENIFLGLRCEIGVDVDLLDEKKITALIEENKCHLVGNKLVANDYFLADEIALWLM
ncbi:radical SAM family heme chaperone HemW [Helicobacter sp. 11S02596-1]|uniref:radical SAM family heme chaperone HemW n=1 Tax=Helicobacter sp. 11S02596-1 TaxID=1476194 RepID=UPI000BA7C83D|nr:radical SAM family heme chaperone HemW [Helicobacter sp. 11S02596-1]PAF41510.1 coproporphyrinogen III oxidase [Helicobacter sp. 11S02596-1]